jgi:hypothetical protein
MKRSKRQRWQDMTDPEICAALEMCERALELVCRELRVEPPLYFLLMLNDPREANFISNVERTGMVKALAECVGRLQRDEDYDRESPEPEPDEPATPNPEG